MVLLGAVILMAGLCCATVLRFAPSASRRLADGVARLMSSGDEEQSELDTAQQLTVEWGPRTQSFVQRRLDALAEELQRLDRDPDIFAKAFHVMVARAAHEALLVDASRLADQPRYAAQLFDVELLSPSTGPREELEL
jgi:hypothetical protein